jgi:hypothetical protein
MQRHDNPLEIQRSDKTVTGSEIHLLIRAPGQIPPCRSDSETDKDHNRDREQGGEDSNESSHRTIRSLFV